MDHNTLNVSDGMIPTPCLVDPLGLREEVMDGPRQVPPRKGSIELFPGPGHEGQDPLPELASKVGSLASFILELLLQRPGHHGLVDPARCP
jgi:hypothetical protein